MNKIVEIEDKDFCKCNHKGIHHCSDESGENAGICIAPNCECEEFKFKDNLVWLERKYEQNS
jgi:hypothetical protein